MLLGIDHLVIAVRDPDAAAIEMERDLGLAVTGGGRHEAWGTFNRLAFLGDAYLELIGVFDAGLVRSSALFAVANAALALLDDGVEGLATFALATDDIAGDVARLQAAGSPIDDPVAGQRLRPDGGAVRWRTAVPALGPGEPPFLIEHEYAGPEWGNGARTERALFHHPAGGRVRLGVLEVPVADVRAAASAYATTVGLTFDDAGSARVGGQQVRLRPADGAPPLVELDADPGSPRLDVVRFGVRWRRRARDGEPG